MTLCLANLSVGDISLMWFLWVAFLGSEALNARLYHKLRKCSLARRLQVAAVRTPGRGSCQFLAQCTAAPSPGKLTFSLAVEARFTSIDSRHGDPSVAESLRRHSRALFAGVARNSDSSERSTMQGKQNLRKGTLAATPHYERMPDTSLLRSHFEYALGS